MKTRIQPVIFLIFLLLLTACDNLQLQEYDGISFDGNKYHLAWNWKPYDERLKDRYEVYLENYDSTVDYKTAYYANSFAGDSEHVFLFFNNQLYVKDDYRFPDISNENVKVDEIILYSPNHVLPSKKRILFEDDVSVSLFI